VILGITMDQQEVLTRLVGEGYRLTPARREVLAALLSRQEPFTIEEVCRQVRRAGRATVFRTVKLLLALGLLCRVLGEGGSPRYRLSRLDHHHHLVCTDCGRITEFTLCPLTELLEEVARATRYEIREHRLELYGRCYDCQQGSPP